MLTSLVTAEKWNSKVQTLALRFAALRFLALASAMSAQTWLQYEKPPTHGSSSQIYWGSQVKLNNKGDTIKIPTGQIFTFLSLLDLLEPLDFL